MLLRLASIAYLTASINAYELVDPEGGELPPFEAGAHITVEFGGALRDYSLWTDPSERRHYGIAVLREAQGALSRQIHDELRVGSLIRTSVPRNFFPLAPDAQRHLLIAGGIGITPIMAMIAELRRRRAKFLLHYCTRSPEETAFLDDLSLLAALGHVQFHHDGGDPARGLDIAATLRDYTPGTHLYYCGPSGLMTAARTASAHWPADSIHCEHFKGAGAARPEL